MIGNETRIRGEMASWPIPGLNVRATEYTVGGTGPKAMPALLPPLSAYTYAVEFSVDEAQAAGATTVQFSQPVVSTFCMGSGPPQSIQQNLRPPDFTSIHRIALPHLGQAGGGLFLGIG